MRKTIAGCLLVLAASILTAADSPPSVTIVGEVVDTTCYLLHDGKGEQHRNCAVTCVKAGTPAAILDDKTHELVFPLTPVSAERHHGKRPDEMLLPYVGKRVRALGVILRRGGVTAIVIEKVEEAR